MCPDPHGHEPLEANELRLLCFLVWLREALRVRFERMPAFEAKEICFDLTQYVTPLPATFTQPFLREMTVTDSPLVRVRNTLDEEDGASRAVTPDPVI